MSNSEVGRQRALERLVNFADRVDVLAGEIAAFEWDAPAALARVESKHVISALDRYYHGILSREDVHRWAELVEFREDLDFGGDLVQRIIIELSNPELFGYLSRDLARELLEKLKSD